MANAKDENATRLGLVGLGIMGAPIAQRLRDKGYPLTVWNLQPERFDIVRDSGATWANSPMEVWEASDVVLTCVLGDDAIESVCFGENGFAGAKGGARVLVDLSTTSPEATLSLARRLRETLGADWLDAPMSGGPLPARQGKITLMIGGEEELCRSLEPVLGTIGSNFTRMGPLGAGQKTKILNQQVVGVNYVLMAELLATARASDIDPDRLVRCLASGMADSVILQRIFTQMAARDFDQPRSSVKQLYKDLKSVCAYLKDLGLDLPLSQLAISQYGRYAETVDETEDGASVSRLYEATGTR